MPFIKLNRSSLIAVLIVVFIFSFFLGRVSKKANQFFSTNETTEELDQDVHTRNKIAEAILNMGFVTEFPSELWLSLNRSKPEELTQVHPSYTIQTDLQNYVSNLFTSSKPKYGAAVVLDASNGQILAITSYSRDTPVSSHLALKATFPSASVFKVVTAAAALSEGALHPDSVIRYSGGNHTLYRSNIFGEQKRRWSREITFKEAFGKSINSIFGKIGALTVGGETLDDFATRFAFNEVIDTDLPVEKGKAQIGADPWEIAQAASGFTQQNTMSPLQGAVIGAIVANDGKRVDPFLISQLTNSEGKVVYQAPSAQYREVIKPDVAYQLQELMHETIDSGTSRKAFRGFNKGKYKWIEAGGKTGSLTGNNPPGKYDWFVGYARLNNKSNSSSRIESDPSHRYSVAILTIHDEYWRVKSSTIARKIIEKLFANKLTQLDTIASRSK